MRVLCMMEDIEKDCTIKCHCQKHAEQIINCVITGTPSQIRAYSVWLCHNFSVITDELGRNLLHAAASCGKWEIVEWLLKYCRADIEIKDAESGWTALHRSFFYGELVSARLLCNHGANLHIRDHEGFTPLDVLLKDRLPYIEYLPTDPSEVYVWGSNFNYNLGTGNLETRTGPEILEIFRKDSISIKQVLICKFHSAFLSVDGSVYTCGVGNGGRLGQKSEKAALVPALIDGIVCEEVAAGQDHLLLLLKGGQVLSCGMNTYHQLGHFPPIEKVLSPKKVSVDSFKEKVVGVRAATFHSVFFTKSLVFTFGLNAGQLGHLKGQPTQITPRQISRVFQEGVSITHVEASDGATVCTTTRGDVFLLHEYQCRKIASRQLEILKISMVGGHLDPKCNMPGVEVGGGLELRILLLTKSGKVFIWRQTDPFLRRCLFSSAKQLVISHLHLNDHTVAMITKDNEAYVGTVSTFGGPRCAPVSLGFGRPLNREECASIHVKRIPHIHRGTAITSDPKGRNFAVLQSSPKMGLVELPTVSQPELQQDFVKLYLELSSGDTFQDITVKVKDKEYSAHKFILASRSTYFQDYFSRNAHAKNVTLDHMKPEAFEQILQFLYTNGCDFLVDGYEVTWGIQLETVKPKKSKTKNENNCITCVMTACKELGVNALLKRLERVRLVDGTIHLKETSLPSLRFSRTACPELSDVSLVCVDGTVISCHKCILITRLDYFRNMFNSCWIEGSDSGQFSLPISPKVMKTILDYLYAEKFTDSDSVDFLCQIVCISDQLFIKRLKELCELALVDLISLKNAAELLEMSLFYNCRQLKATCMEYMCINLAALIEAKGLDQLSIPVMQELTHFYKTLVPSVRRRVIRPHPKCPTAEELVSIEKIFPVQEDCMIQRNPESKTKNRRRNTLKRLKSNSESSDIILECDVPQVKPDSQIIVEDKPVAPKEVPKLQWCPQLEHFPELNKIMEKEKKRLQTNKNCSQKKSPPNRSVCPWGQEPPCKENQIKSHSFEAIQKAEEKKQHNVLKVKPLHIINIEDQAIEDLLDLYNAKNNPNERVTVSRVLAEDIASPVWKKKAF